MSDGAGDRDVTTRGDRGDSPWLLVGHDLSRVYRPGGPPVHAVRDVSIQVRAGELVTVEGASGSGKSTLLNLLGGLDRPDTGWVSLAGQRFDRLSDRKLARLRRQQIGFVFQRHHLLARLTAWENVALPSLLDGGPAASSRARALYLLQQVGLAHRADHRAVALSGGEQQRVAVARALANQPRLVVADEPTGAVDSAAAAAVLELLGQLAVGPDCALLMVTHDRAVAASGTRRFSLHDGVLVEQRSEPASGPQLPPVAAGLPTPPAPPARS